MKGIYVLCVFRHIQMEHFPQAENVDLEVREVAV